MKLINKRVLSLLAALMFPWGCEEGNTRDAAPIQSDAGMGGRNCDAAPNNWQVQDPGFGNGAVDKNVNFFDVWGDNENAVWAVGSGGQIVFFDGQKWSTQQTPTQSQLTSVWGILEIDVWAVGFESTVLHFDGEKWENNSPPDELFWDRDGGVPEGDAAVGLRPNLWGVWSFSEGEITKLYAVGDNGLVLFFDGTEWSKVRSGVEEKLTGVWGYGNQVFVVGDFGTFLVGNDPKKSLSKKGTGIDKALRSVWGRDGSHVYAVGLSGTVLFYDGDKVRKVEGAPPAPPQFLRDIWGEPGKTGEIYIVGWNGVILRMRGTPPFSEGAEFDAFTCVTTSRLEA
ncbi:MAG: hypothetical protein V1754_14840, partial [Pseudomonadota bacterium]